ncbi:hypothetical protein ANN_22946 [Periplaneta americana]|uniref:Uncharacterized protein n=1 Tax=Periplaneta americana TaxID=6978 RepID=A0ABQ8SKQ8_PERAM|nr:hypothetical protein ANN_22946 [Periplaneta americana]
MDMVLEDEDVDVEVLHEAYADAALPYRTVTRWVKAFREGRDVKVMFIVAYDIDGVILHHAVPPRQTENADYWNIHLNCPKKGLDPTSDSNKASLIHRLLLDKLFDIGVREEEFLDSPVRATCPAYLKRLDLTFLIMSGEEYNAWSSAAVGHDVMAVLANNQSNGNEIFRRTAGYTLLDRKRNEEILEQLEVESVEEKISRYKFNWLDHVRRMENSRIPKIMMQYKLRGHRRPGRPLRRLLDGAETGLQRPNS